MHKNVHEGKYDHKINELCCLCDTLVSWTKGELGVNRDQIDTNELGEGIDMIKDLCEAIEKLHKAEYYDIAAEAMLENPMAFAPEFVQDQIQNDRAGYDHYRYASGRFAPKGHGHRSGYTEIPHHMPEMEHMERELMHGVPYRDYMKHRMHYTETHHPEDKHMMDEHAKRHVLDTAETVTEIYKAADPELKRDIKMELQKLVNQMI